MDDRCIFFDKIGNYHVSEELDHRIIILNNKGEKIKSFGEAGKYYDYEPVGMKFKQYTEEEFKEEYLKRRKGSYRYTDIYFDEDENIHYRFYVGPKDSDLKYLHIYVNEKLVADFKVDYGMTVVKAEKGFLYYYMQPERIDNEFNLLKKRYSELL